MALPQVGLEAVIENIDGFNNAAQQVTDGYNDIDDAANQVEVSSGGLSGALSGVGSILSGAVVAAAAAVAAAIAAVTVAFGALSYAALDVAQDMKQASNALIIGTGASGQALEEMEDIVKSLSESSAGVGHSYEDMGATVAEVNTRLGLQGDELENVSAQILTYSRLTGQDAVQATQSITRTMGDWGIESENAGELLDKLFGASQAFGIGTDDLSRKLVQFGAPLRQMGFSIEESIALFGKWEKEGVNTGLAIGSLRIAAAKFAKENIPLRDGLNQTMEAIKGASTESEALTIAMEIFGSRAGPDMSAAIREGRFELDSAIEALQGTSGGLEDAGERTITFGDKMGIMWNKVRNSLLPFGDAMLDVANRILPFVNEAIEYLTPLLAQLAEFLRGTLIQAWKFLRNAIGEFFLALEEGDGPLKAIKSLLRELFPENIFNALDGLVDAVYELFLTVFPDAESGAKSFGETISNILAGAIEFVANVVIPGLTSAIKFATAAWPIFKDVVKSVIDILSTLGDILDDYIIPFISDLWDQFKESKKSGKTLMKTFDNIIESIEPLVDKVLPELLEIWEVIKKWTEKNWPLIQKTIETVMKAIQDIIEQVTDNIQKFWEQWGDEIMAFTEFMMETIFKVVKLNLENLLDIFTLIMQLITGDWEGAWNTIKDIAERTTAAINDIVDAAFELLVQIVSDWMDDAEEYIAGVWDSIKTTATTKLEELKTLVGTKFQELKTAITTKMQEIFDAISSKWEEIKTMAATKAGEMITKIIEVINAGVESIKTAFINMFTSAINAIDVTAGALGTSLSAIGTSLVTQIKTAVEGAWVTLRDGISNILSWAADNLATFPQWLITKIKTIGGNIVQKIKEGVDAFKTSLKTQITTTIGAAVDLITSLPSTVIQSLKDIGNDVIQAIIDGINAAKQTLANILSGVADLIPQWLYDFIFGGGGQGFSGFSGPSTTNRQQSISAPARAPLPPLFSSPQATGQNIFNVGGNTIASNFDMAIFEARVLEVIRRNL